MTEIARRPVVSQPDQVIKKAERWKPPLDEQGRANLEAVLDTKDGRAVYRTWAGGGVMTWDVEGLIGQLSVDEKETLFPRLLPDLGRRAVEFWGAYTVDSAQGWGRVPLRKYLETSQIRGPRHCSSDSRQIRTVGEVFDELLEMARGFQETIDDEPMKRKYREAELALGHVVANGDRLPSCAIQIEIGNRQRGRLYEGLTRPEIFRSLPVTMLNKESMLFYSLSAEFLTTDTYQRLLGSSVQEENPPVKKLTLCLTEPPGWEDLAPEDKMTQQVKNYEREARATGDWSRPLVIGDFRTEIELDPVGLRERDVKGLSYQARCFRLGQECNSLVFWSVKEVLDRIIRQREASLSQRRSEQSPYLELGSQEEAKEAWAAEIRQLKFIYVNLDRVTPGLGKMSLNKAVKEDTTPNLKQLEELLSRVKLPLEALLRRG